jgi:hypothetical protein
MRYKGCVRYVRFMRKAILSLMQDASSSLVQSCRATISILTHRSRSASGYKCNLQAVLVAWSSSVGCGARCAREEGISNNAEKVL